MMKKNSTSAAITSATLTNVRCEVIRDCVWETTLIPLWILVGNGGASTGARAPIGAQFCQYAPFPLPCWSTMG